MQPPPYVRFQSNNDYQTSHQLPGPALSGASLDVEFDRIKATLDGTLGNLALIQRDDGKLNNQSVSPDSLSSAVVQMIAGWNPRGLWVTLTSYAFKDMVQFGTDNYVCIVTHVAGVFATDLGAGKWAMVATKGDPGLQGVAGPAGASRAGFVNRLINGDFAIDQRNEGAAKSYVAGANVAYGVDRWYASCTGTNVSGQRVAGTNINQFAYKFTGAPLNTGLVFGHRIESVNVSDLISQVVTVQVWLSSNSITSVNWKTFSANTTDAWGTKSTSGTGTETAIDSGTLTITPTPTLYSFQTNLGANAAKGIDVEFSCGALLATNTLQFEAVQLEAGNVASPYDRQEFNTRIERCKRYYTKSYAIGTAPATATRLGIAGPAVYVNTVAVIPASITFAAPMRATPTLNIWDGAGTANLSTILSVSGPTTVFSDAQTVCTLFDTSARGFLMNPPAGNCVAYEHYTADAEL
jgi:hypothetical protein